MIGFRLRNRTRRCTLPTRKTGARHRGTSMVDLSSPPRLPATVALADGDGLRHARFRIWQWGMSLITVLITVWFMTLGPIPGVIAVVVAKHVLVAILVAGLGMDVAKKI